MFCFGADNALLTHRPYGIVPAEAAGPSVDAPAPCDEVRAESRLPTAGMQLASAFASARAALSNLLDLMALEARRAGLALMWMVAWGLVAAICIVAAWLGLVAALAMWAVSLGLPPIATVLAVAVINVAAGAVLIYVCLGISRDLLFSATRRQVAGTSPVKPVSP